MFGCHQEAERLCVKQAVLGLIQFPVLATKHFLIVKKKKPVKEREYI